MSIQTRADLDAALLSDDPAAALRAALADGSLDALIPEIRVEMDFPQRTRYHALTNLEHSLRTCALVPARLDERLAALFHDLGKRRTTTIKPSNGDEQYLGHAPAGARMARAILERLGYEPQLIETVCFRIAHHMDLHSASANGWSDKAVTKLLGKIECDLPALMRLQLADTATMAPDFAADKLPVCEAYHAHLWDWIEANR